MLYGVKNIIQYTISGKPDPSKIDEHYIENYQAFEESVMIVIANSFDEAYDIAEEKAREVNESYQNQYGQTVTVEFVDSINCFKIGEEDEDLNGLEVYSNIVGRQGRVTSERYIKKYFKIDSSIKHMLLKLFFR